LPEQHFDIAVIGGGVVGLSSALHFCQTFPRLKLVLLEKENSVAQHQSGRNSGVIHSGIYYKPGSLKARLCVEGAAAMIVFCREHSIPYEVCGKIITATSTEEVPRLNELLKRGQANGVAGLKLLSHEEVREIEPHCGGVAWLHVPGTGITDYKRVCEKYAELIAAAGGTVATSTELHHILRNGTDAILETNRSSFRAKYVINCAGLHSDRVSRMAGVDPAVQIMPFRGEYYDLIPERRDLVRTLIYPVPDLRFPFLGVHFTRRVSGEVDAGPNAVLAFKREGYHMTDISVADLSQNLSSPGFWKMASKYWRDGAGEFYRSFRKSAFVHALRRLVPDVRSSDLEPSNSGVRAQAVRPDGFLVDDFQFVCKDNMLHVWNVPSPAATASLPIGREIVKLAQDGFGLR
jgi:L-2-hydroxyglutarate oxidase LhgO